VFLSLLRLNLFISAALASDDEDLGWKHLLLRRSRSDAVLRSLQSVFSGFVLLKASRRRRWIVLSHTWEHTAQKSRSLGVEGRALNATEETARCQVCCFLYILGFNQDLPLQMLHEQFI
jgi:hypothetical protein